jgi:hypothetical protein
MKHVKTDSNLKSIFSFCLIFMVSAFVSACGTVAVNVPAGRMISSESLPKWKSRIGTGGGTQATYTIEKDASSRPLQIDTPEIQPSAELAWARGGLGFGEGFELGLKIGTLVGSSGLFGKYQVFGPRTSEGVADDTSLSIVLGIVGGQYSASGDQNGTFGPGGHNWNARVSSSGGDASLVYGHRASEKIIFFGGPFYTTWNYSAKIHHTRSDDGSYPEADYEITGSGTRKGLTVALEFSTQGRVRFVLVPEIILSQTSWTNSEAREWVDVSVMAAIQF